MPGGPAEAATHLVTSQDARLWVQVSGAGVPLVLVHGWAMDHRIFRPQLEAFARHFRVVAYDRRGYGQSAGAPDLAREVDDLDAIAEAVIGEPFGESFHLLALSQGARIALRYAAARPDRLRSLIVQGAPADAEEPDDPVEERIPLEAFAALAKAGRLDELRRRWLQHPMMRLGEGHTEAEHLLREMLADYSGADLISGGWQPHEEAGVLQAVAAARTPALILTGARETTSRRRSARMLLEALPQARELLLSNSGHLSNLTEPDIFNAAVFDFCRDVDGRREV